MIRTLSPLPVLLSLVLAGSAAAQPLNLQSPAVARALAAIDTAAIAAHVRFLADDLLEGRGTGSRGYEIAARYVASRFAEAGLEPAGDAGTYLQRVPLRHATLVPGSASVAFVRRGKVDRLRFEEDYVMPADMSHEVSRVSASMVFAGYGVTAPELGYDDFAGVDVRGKVVVMLSGAPPFFPNDQRAHYSKGSVRTANLAARGAIGYLTVRTPWDEKRATWERTVRQSRQGGMDWLDERGVPQGVHPELRASLTLRRPAAERLFAAAGRTLDSIFAVAEKARPLSFDLGAEARIERRSRHREVAGSNVLGLLRGGDPKLRDEVVVYTGHLDHLGISSPVRGDSINNGALDNAAGIALLLEVAQAFAAGERPRRSILFLALTAEEKGMQGSEYFASRPFTPIERIVANVNVDMPLMLFPLADVVAFGAEHSSLGAIVERAAARVEMTVSPDPVPEEVIFVRSDQYSFVKQGVPSVFVTAGRKSRDPSIDGAAIAERWMDETYHSPQDDLTQAFDWDSGRRFARLNYLIGLLIAQQSARPAWNPGDFFGETFGRPR
jgi:hypothetical protein